MKFQKNKTKITRYSYFFSLFFALFIIFAVVSSLVSEDPDARIPEEVSSVWDANPIEINAVNIQVLDKISGKVLRKQIKIGKTEEFGNIRVTLKRCFKNAPEDSKEIYAFIEISEYKTIFAKWLFASSPSINVFEHPQYDVRVEF